MTSAAGNRKSRTVREETGAEAAKLAVPEMEEIIGYKLRLAQLLVFQDFIESFSELRLRPAEFSVLVLISRFPGLKQTEIAERLGIKRANFVALMDGLESRGLAERRKSERDKRSHSLHLTADGHQFVHDMLAVWKSHEQRFVARLGGTEARDTFIELLNRLLQPSDTESSH